MQETQVQSPGWENWRRKWQLTPVFLPGESHGQRSLAGYSPQGHTEWDTTEQLSTHRYKETGTFDEEVSLSSVAVLAGCTLPFRPRC